MKCAHQHKETQTGSPRQIVVAECWPKKTLKIYCWQIILQNWQITPFKSIFLIKRFLKLLVLGGYFIYTGAQKYRAGHGWGCPAYPLTPNLSTSRKWKLRQQLLLQVDSCDWKEKSAFSPFQQGCKYSNHLSTKGHLKCKASILYNPEDQWHRLPRPSAGSGATHAREKPLLEKQIGNALEKGQSTLVLPSALGRVMKSQSAGPQGHFASKFHGGGLKLGSLMAHIKLLKWAEFCYLWI